MKRFGLVAALSFACAGVALLGGCGGGGSASTITIEIIPPATGASVDVGTTQPLNFTATLGDDTTNAGVTWALSGTSCSGDGCGTLSNQDKFSVSYTPPTALPSATVLSVTLTATSAAQKKVTATTAITVEPLPKFTTTNCNPPNITPGTATPCGLPDGANGVGYNEPIQMSGGVGPYTFAVTNVTVGGNPASLASVCLKLTIAQTSATSTAVAGIPCNLGTGASGTDPMPLSFMVQVTDSGGAAPVLQSYTMNLTPAPPLSILTTSLPAANENAQYSAQVKVNGGVNPITWAILPSASSLPPGLSISATKGTITGVPTAAGSYSFSVQVTDSARIPIDNNQPPTTQHQTQTQAYTLTVQQPGPLSISPVTGTTLSAGTTAAGYSASIQASGGVQPYIWSVTQGQLPPGLALAANQAGNGVISGVPTMVGTYAFTVQVQDSEVAPATKTATAQYTITIAAGQDNNSLFRGAYSFIFRGFDKDGSVAMIGTLNADGIGGISGAEVINRISGVAPVVTFTGTYFIDSSGTTGGTSGDGRGQMELTATIGQQTVTSVYELALESDGSIRFIQHHDYSAFSASPPSDADTFATHGEGAMKPVIGGGFASSSFSGNYAFEFTGQDTANKPDALVGFVHANGTSQTLSPGTCDFNDNGNYGSQSISGEFSFSGSAVGAAELTLEVPTTGQQTLQFEYVFVSQSDLYFIEVDSSGSANTPTLYRMSGEMILQQPGTSFDSNSLAGNSVATTSGVDSSGNAMVTAGLLVSTVCDGTTQNSLAFDQNDAGTITSPSPLSETCTVNPSNGRVALSWAQPAVAPPFAAAYLIGPGKGFLIGNDATVSTGLLELQTAPAPIGNSSVSGAYAVSSPFIFEAGVNNLLGETIVDGSTGQLTGTVDEADASGTSQTLNQSLTGTILAVSASGRGTVTTTAAAFPANWIFYVVSRNQIRAISADSGNQHPQLIFLGP